MGWTWPRGLPVEKLRPKWISAGGIFSIFKSPLHCPVSDLPLIQPNLAISKVFTFYCFDEGPPPVWLPATYHQQAKRPTINTYHSLPLFPKMQQLSSHCCSLQFEVCKWTKNRADKTIQRWISVGWPTRVGPSFENVKCNTIVDVVYTLQWGLH